MSWILGVEEKQFLVHDDGSLWDITGCAIQYDRETLLPLTDVRPEPDDDDADAELPLKEEKPNADQSFSIMRSCEACGFEAKSLAGLKAHRRRCKA